jgi:hypothetical protein
VSFSFSTDRIYMTLPRQEPHGVPWRPKWSVLLSTQPGLLLWKMIEFRRRIRLSNPPSWSWAVHHRTYLISSIKCSHPLVSLGTLPSSPIYGIPSLSQRSSLAFSFYSKDGAKKWSTCKRLHQQKTCDMRSRVPSHTSLPNFFKKSNKTSYALCTSTTSL